MIENNPYPGRGILLGQSEDGQKAVMAYFIMGRSENSRNRVFRANGNDFSIEIFRQDHLRDASLILYTPQRMLKNHVILTNGDQTDTIYQQMQDGKTFEDALATRTFEPDAPNYTPRISGIVTFRQGAFTYKLSILKAGDGAGKTCIRNTFSYEPEAGCGRLIHTYAGDGTPLPAFTGEPETVAIKGSIDAFSKALWNQLNPQNRVSLYVRFTDLNNTDQTEIRIFNQREETEKHA